MATAFLAGPPVVSAASRHLAAAAPARKRPCSWAPGVARGYPRHFPHRWLWGQRRAAPPAVGETARRSPLPLRPAASAAAGSTGGGGSGDDASSSSPPPPPPPPPPPRLRRYISSAQGRSLVTEAITTTYGGSAQAYATAAAGSVVDAITATYTVGGGEADGEGGGGGPPSVLVAFGVGLTGAVGVEAAVGLAAAGYTATLLRVGEEEGRPPWRVAAEAAAEAAGVDIIDFVPASAAFYFDLLVDAVLGNDPLDWGDGVDADDAPHVEASGTPPPPVATTDDAASGGLIPDGATTVLAALAASPAPVVCVDHPLGWATDRGPPDLAVRRDAFVKPDLLVSTAVPLRSARFFGGRYHYVGGGVVPPGWAAAAGVAVREPPPPGGVRAVLFGGRGGGRRGGSGGSGGAAGPARPGGLSGGVSTTGDVYGGLGGEEGAQGWMGTLFVKDGRREWVHVEDNEDLWDELD